jgi:ribose-phosphate pyrophosphokinase
MAGTNGAIKLVAGNSNPRLAEAIAARLRTPLAKAVVRRFADMEIFVEILENVRGADVFVVQSTSYPANDHLMELLIIIVAPRRAASRRWCRISAMPVRIANPGRARRFQRSSSPT